jgi:hypothetical protein|tara:strand:- start:770 stop:940 length:171 start_codon:yes stop_codon:yes gene_type:complete
MKKNPAENFTSVEVDPVSGEYYTVIPEWIINEYGWYEGTELNFRIDEGDIFLEERE